MKKNLVLLIIACSCISQIKSQNSDTLFYSGNYSVVIDSIIISGNNQTEDFIILRELTFERGDTLNPQLARYNRERVYSLDIFNEVGLKTFKTNNCNYLLIDIEESWYIYPIPIAFLNDRDWNKISYGVAVKIKNFRGRNEEIFSKFTLGFDPSVDLAYFNPNLARDLDLFTEFQFGYSKSKNRSNNAIRLTGGDFDYNVYYGRIIFGKRFGLFHRVFLNTGFDYIESPFYIKNVSASNQRIDRTVVLGLNYAYDTRDLIQYAKDGIFIYAGYEFKGLGINNINYGVLKFDFRFYRSLLSNFVTKWNLALRMTNGSVPYYDLSYLGRTQRIRGHWKDAREGHDFYFSSLEFDYWILDDYRLNFHWVPLLPESLLSYRVGFIWQIFIDTGTTRFHGEPLTLKSFEIGYGTGISILLLPYFTLRVEYALNNQFKGQWIIDLGASF